MTHRERAERRAAALADRRRRHDTLRESLAPLARLAVKLARSTRGHPLGEGEPIKVRVLRKPAETNPDRMLPYAIEIEAYTGATLRFKCADDEPVLVVDQDLRDGRRPDHRVFDRVEAMSIQGDDGPYMLYANRKPVSIPAVLLHFEEVAVG